MALVIVGDGGHARSLRFVYRAERMLSPGEVPSTGDQVMVGVGDIPTRRRLYEEFRGQIYNRGLQIMDGARVGANVTLGVNVLLNTGCQVDHDCVIGDHCVIAPGAILCGGVKLGEACFIGAGAIIVEGVELGPETFVQAGTLVAGPNDFRSPQRVVRNL